MRIPNIGETDLLVPLHDGVFEQPMWSTFLERLRALASVRLATILLRPAGSDHIIQLSGASGPTRGKAMRVFSSEYRGDPLGLDHLREGRVYALDELVGAGRGEAVLFAEGPLAESGIASLRITRLRDAGGLHCWLALADGEPLGADSANLIAALAPHLQVALRVVAALERERTRSSLSAEAFNRINFGWISLDARCRIVELDDQAEALLQQSGLLRRGPYDRLMTNSAAADRQLTALTKEFAADPKARPRAINLSRDPWIDLLVAPIHLDTLAGEGRPVAIIYFRGDNSSQADRCEQLIDLFDLTPSEARLAWSMAQGMSIAEAADQNGLTIETARNYSKKIYAKTGARGQVDLLRHIQTGVLALA